MENNILNSYVTLNVTTEPNDVQTYLKEKRKALGLKQYEVAQLLGMSTDVYRKYELGDRTPKPERFEKMKSTLDACESNEYKASVNEIIAFLEQLRKGSFTFIFDKETLSVANNVFNFIIKNVKIYYRNK